HQRRQPGRRSPMDAGRRYRLDPNRDPRGAGGARPRGVTRGSMTSGPAWSQPSIDIWRWRQRVGSLLVGVVISALCLACQQQPEMDVFGATPSFNLTDQTGASFTSQSLTGRVTLLDFVYTHCTDACPLLSATFQDTQRKLAHDTSLANKVTL